ncbi:hypothetical protein S83_059927, partial [Arachis hypogaea]
HHSSDNLLTSNPHPRHLRNFDATAANPAAKGKKEREKEKESTKLSMQSLA